LDLQNARSEPLVALAAFHTQFNRNIKFSFGALTSLRKGADASRGTEDEPITLPTGGEPWGPATKWRDVDSMLKRTEAFIAELGLVRASSAFEDYLTSATAEFDRANGDPEAVACNGPRERLMARVGVTAAEVDDETTMVDFFECARNCIVHRSGRASPELAERAASEQLHSVISRWPRRVAIWKVGLPDIKEGEPIAWKPRHAIMASDAFYRLGVLLDRGLVRALGTDGMVRMAAHWCLFSDVPAPCGAKLNAQVMVRSQLADRYRVTDVSQAETIASLRAVGKWEDALTAHARRFPDGPRPYRSKRRKRS